MSSPGAQHFKALNRIWGYINRRPNYGLHYNKVSLDELRLKAYTDASWADSLGARSTSGYTFFLGNNNTISWVSHLQKTVATSTCEAEYIGCKFVS
jgi:hypothetical protein